MGVQYKNQEVGQSYLQTYHRVYLAEKLHDNLTNPLVKTSPRKYMSPLTSDLAVRFA